jgi:hypothetical protein
MKQIKTQQNTTQATLHNETGHNKKIPWWYSSLNSGLTLAPGPFCFPYFSNKVSHFLWSWNEILIFLPTT